MNEQLQVRIQEYIAAGKSPAWIANELYFEDESVDHAGVKNYAASLLDESKKKDSEEVEAPTTPLIASVPSEEELASSTQIQPLDVKTIGKEYTERFKADLQDLQLSIIEQDEEFAQTIQDINNSDKSDQQKNYEIQQHFQKRTHDKQKELFQTYSDEINNRIVKNTQINPEQYANILYRDFGLPIPLDGDDRYNESTFWGGSFVDFLTDNGTALLTSAIDFVSGPISQAAAGVNVFVPQELKGLYAQQMDQKLADVTANLNETLRTQYSTGFFEKASDIQSVGDVAELFSRATQTISESAPIMAGVAFSPYIAGAVITDNAYVDSKREDFTRESQGLEPIFDNSFSGEASRLVVSSAEGVLSAASGGVQNRIAREALRKFASNPSTRQTFKQFLVDYARTQGVDIGLEGLIEGGQELTTMGLEDLLGNIDYSSDDYFERVREAFVLGVASSGTISGGGLAVGALDARADVVTRPQAAANSRVEKSGMTSNDVNTVDALNQSKTGDNILNRDFNQDLRAEKTNREAFYRMMTMRHPNEMKQINDLDIAIEQVSIRYKRAQEGGATQEELDGITRDVYGLVDKRMSIVSAFESEAVDLTPQESRRYEDGRIAHRMNAASKDVNMLQEQLNALETEALIPNRVRPEQLNTLSEHLEMAKAHKTEALRLLGELGNKRSELAKNRTPEAEAAATEAENNLRNHLGLFIADPEVQAKEAEVKPLPENVREATPEEYTEAMARAFEVAKEKDDKKFLQLDQVGLETAQTIASEGGKLFITEDGSAGAYVKADGYMGGMFKSPDSELKGVSNPLQKARVENGGKYFDAYGTELEDIYVKNGFKPVARVKFNPEYAPEGWDAENSPLKNQPDLVFFARGKGNVGDGKYVADYDAGAEIAKASAEASTPKTAPQPAPEPEVTNEETFTRGIEGEFEEYQAKDDGSIAITSLSGLTRNDIRFINKNLASALKAASGSKFKIVAHRTKASGDRASKVQGENIALAVNNPDGSIEVHLNLERLAEARKNGKEPRAVLMEELLHPTIGPALRTAYKSNPNVVYKLIDDLEAIAKKSGREDLIAIVADKGEAYRQKRKAKEQEVTEEQVIEYFTELLDYDYSDPTILDKIRVAINKFLKATIGKDAMLIDDVTQAKAILQKLQRSIRTGEAITVSETAADPTVERAAISPSKLPENEPFTVEYVRSIYGKSGIDLGGRGEAQTFNGKWHFINWWKNATNMGKGRGYNSFASFTLVDKNGNREPINVDVMKNWKLKPPVYKEDIENIRREKEIKKRYVLSDFYKAIGGRGYKTFNEYISQVFSDDRKAQLDRYYMNSYGEIPDINESDNHIWDMSYNFATLEEVQEAYGKWKQDKGIDDTDGTIERAAIAFSGRIRTEPELAKRHEAQKADKARALCAVGSGTCLVNDKVSLLQMESALVKQQIGDNPSMAQSVDIAAQSLDILKQHIMLDQGVDVTDAVGNYNEGVDAIMTAVASKPQVEVNPTDFKMMLDLLVAYTSNGSMLDPNLDLSLQLFYSGLVRIQGGATEFISPSRIEAISKRESDGTLGFIRGDRANTMASHLSDINSIFKKYYVDGNLNSKQFFEDAKKRDKLGVPALASMIGKNTPKLADLYLGNAGDPNAIPKDGHFRDQYNVFRGKFNEADYSEGLVIPEEVRTSSIDALNDLGASLTPMNSDADIFAAIKQLKATGDEAVRNAAARVYKKLVGNNIEQLRDFSAYEDVQSTLFVKKVAKAMGLTPFQVQQLMYHDGIYSMSSYQGRPFISDYKSGMIRAAAKDFTSVRLDAVPGEQMALAFDNVDPITEVSMPTPGKKLLPAQKDKAIDASTSQLYRERSKKSALAMTVRGTSVNMSQSLVDDALSTDATSKRILGKGITVEEGRKVGIRLNLNVMKNTGVPVQTVHEKSASGEALTYAPAVTVKNAELYVNQNARNKIVTFQENKFPMASVNGEFVESGTDLNYSGVKAFFNPFRHNVFVDAAGRPVKSAEEATIVGNTVYMRGKIEYYDMSDPVVRSGRIETEEQKIKRTTRGPKYDKAVARFEAYAKGQLGMEFASRAELEAAYDNMKIPSEVALSESEVAENMATAVERAAVANFTNKKMRQTAARQKRRFVPDVRSKIVQDPRNYITPQKLKSLKKDIQDLTDQELIDIVNDEQLGAISMMNDNLGVLAQAERLARAVARGEADSIPDLIAEMSAMGTTAGRLLRHFREVRKSSPKGLVSIITAAVEAKGNKLTEEQASRLDDIAGRMFQAQAIVEDLKTKAIRGEKVGKELEDAIKSLKAVEREMDTFTNVVIERGWGELLGQIAQGNLLTTMSQATNVEANGVNSILDVGVDITSAPVKAFMSSLSKLAGKEYDADRRVSLAAYFYAMSHMGKNFVDTIDQVITGQDKDTTEWRQSRGLMPFRSMMAAISGKDIPPSQRAKLAVQGTLGVPAEVMFRLLSLGDTPFRKYFEDKNLYEQAMQMGLEGEALADFLKHPPRKNAEKARGAGRRITFQEETAFSKGVNESIGFVERKLGEAMDLIPYVNGEQTAKALLRFMIPFRSTPANILIESATFASPVVAAARAAGEMKKGNLDEASRHVAKAMIGAVVTETAVMLLSEGILSGPVQWDEDEEKNLAYDQFPPTSINISALKRMIAGEDTSKQDDDVFVNYMKLGLPGALMAAVAVGYDKEELREREYNGAIDFAKHMFSDMVGIGPLTAAGSMMEQSFLQGLNDFLQILAGGDVERSAENLANSIANVAMSVALPNQFSAIYRAQREFLPDRRITKDMNQAERLMANLEYTVKDRTFGGADIPVRIDWKGNPIKQNPRGNVGWFYQLFDVTKIRQGEADPVSQEIYRLFETTEQISTVVSTPAFAKKRKVNVPDIKSKKERMALRILGKDYTFLDDQEFTAGGVYFNTEQMNRLMEVAGKERYQDVSNLMNSVNYEMLSDDEKLEALNEVNDRYNSVKEYDGRRFKNHTVAILDIMQEIYESREQQD